MPGRRLTESERFPRLAQLGIPDGRRVVLPGRGTTWVREAAGPAGAPTLMLLHGLTATGGLNWAPAFGPLTAHFRVVAIDQRGHGRGIRSSRFRLADCADDVVALADELGIDRFIPVGYSMGGPVAQLVWNRHHDRVAGLVLCATSRDFRGRLDDQLLFLGVGALSAVLHPMPRMLGRAGWSWVARLAAGEFDEPALREWAVDELSHHDPRMVAEAAVAIGRFSSRAWISGVDVPTAVLATEHDQLVPLRRQLRLAETIPSAVVHPVNGDHFAITRSAAGFVTALTDACLLVARRGEDWGSPRSVRRSPSPGRATG